MRPIWILLALAVCSQGQNLNDTARQLAALAPARSKVALAIENRSGVPAATVEVVRREIEDKLRAVMVEPAADGVPMRVILAANPRGPLIIGQSGGRTIVLPWTPPPAPESRARIVLEPVVSHRETVLDFLVDGDLLLILEPARLVAYRRSAGGWSQERAAGLAFPAPMPRDPRGRVLGTAEGFRIVTPAGSCQGTATPAMAIQCGDAGTGPWIPARNTLRQPEVAVIRSECGAMEISSRSPGDDPDALAAGPAVSPLPLEGAVREIWPSSDPSRLKIVIQRNEVRGYELAFASIACTQ